MRLEVGHCDCLCSEYVYAVLAVPACSDHMVDFG